MRHPPLLVANWKMYPTVADGVVLANAVKKALEEVKNVDVVLCPPAVILPLVHDALTTHRLSHLHLGVQNISNHETGPFTGEISAGMVKAMARYAIVGHSERVKWFHETPHETNQKLHIVLKHKLTPILCVGEQHRHSGAVGEVVEKLKQLVRGIAAADMSKLIIAYEPVWAIGTNDPASGEYAQRAARGIRSVIGDESRILYGGSTDSANIAEFLSQDDISGALVGHASVKAKEFIKMCEIAAGVR